ncbi:NAD(P)/FAD-dependent oxidoreductase [Rhodococcus koreensis]|uniref:NAD(P)/FAD-dependent oxidoreductase n=1 Tax=Rhodococcus koreensis TaxID=99653 RepID=UPI0036D9CC36
MTGTLIVGGGQAGAQAAFSLREMGYTADITIVGSEPHLPYQRPPLSKAFLAGTADHETLQFRKLAYYDKIRVEVLCNQRVTDIEFDGGTADVAGTAQLHDGTEKSFHHLMLAVGGRPRRLTVPGSDLTGVCYLRTIADAVQLITHLEHGASVVVIGGGFVGLEAAAMARGRGKTVTVVELAERLLSRTVAPEMSAFLTEAHQRRGTHIRLGDGVTAIEGNDGQATGVRLSDGSLLPADVVIVGVGMTPRLELAERLGLETAGGIVVDSFARTSDSRVVAAGDCTVMPNPMTGSGFVRLESVQNAVDQAKVAAASIAGQPFTHSALPWFWSNQGDLKLQMAGLTEGYDHVELRGEPAAEKFSAFYYRDGRLLAVHAVNRPQDYMLARKALSQRMTIPPDRVADGAAALVAVP